jgi:hypothetical protein
MVFKLYNLVKVGRKPPLMDMVLEICYQKWFLIFGLNVKQVERNMSIFIHQMSKFILKLLSYVSTSYFI